MLLQRCDPLYAKPIPHEKFCAPTLPYVRRGTMPPLMVEQVYK